MSGVTPRSPPRRNWRNNLGFTSRSSESIEMAHSLNLLYTAICIGSMRWCYTENAAMHIRIYRHGNIPRSASTSNSNKRAFEYIYKYARSGEQKAELTTGSGGIERVKNL